jgi:hypothetical protein
MTRGPSEYTNPPPQRAGRRRRLRRIAALSRLSAVAWVRRRLAEVLANAASRLAPDLRPQCLSTLSTSEQVKLPALSHLNLSALQEGRVEVRYRALDPLWDSKSEISNGLIPLHEHITRLYRVADELSRRKSSDWRGVGENLHLAASLSDLSANTDIHGDTMMCRDAAEFERANSELAEKYLAGVIVFSLTWTAYESAVEIASEPFRMKQPKGARGRDLLLQLLGDKHFPYLRNVVLKAFALKHHHRNSIDTPEMRKLIRIGATAAMAAEYLRDFRNALAHGALTKPLPTDWGENSGYCPNQDPAIVRFNINIRLVLLLIQVLARSALRADDELEGWLPCSQPGLLLLTQLHCALPERRDLELPLNDVRLNDEEW